MVRTTGHLCEIEIQAFESRLLKGILRLIEICQAVSHVSQAFAPLKHFTAVSKGEGMLIACCRRGDIVGYQTFNNSWFLLILGTGTLPV